MDAIILAGGRAQDAMAALTGTHIRAMFEFESRPFVQAVYDALRQCNGIDRIAIIGPPELAQLAGLASTYLILPELDTITANLFHALRMLAPKERVLITACDNPLLTTDMFADFIARASVDAGVAYPILPYHRFAEYFPKAENIGISLRDGKWIGGACAILRADTLSQLEISVKRVLDSRKSLVKMVRLLGPMFALRFALRLAALEEVRVRAAKIAGVDFQFVPDCHPAFAIDIDDPEDWEYLMKWNLRD